jgi:Protein of unknown function (DUF973)/zinc-ribbon domain
MSARFCSFCGKLIPSEAAFCPYCGTAAAGAVRPPPPGFAPGPLPGSPPFGYATRPGPPTWLVPPSESRAVDLSALSTVTLAAVLALAGVLLSLLITSLINVSGFVSVSTGSSGTTISLPPAWVWAVLLVVTAGFDLAELLLYRSAFRSLSRGDPRFSTPASLAIVAFIGLVLALLGVAAFLSALYSAVACAGSGMPIPSSCLLTSTFWAGVALLGVGGLIAVIGYIGVLIGIWRLGTRYEAPAFKVGAVLTIIPYLSVIGAILILVAARSSRGKIQRGGTGSFSPG